MLIFEFEVRFPSAPPTPQLLTLPFPQLLPLLSSMHSFSGQLASCFLCASESSVLKRSQP